MAYQKKVFEVKKCVFCGKTFRPVKSYQKLCSDDCRNLYWKQYAALKQTKKQTKVFKKKCPECHKIFETKIENKKFCSQECLQKFSGSGSPFVGKLSSSTVGTIGEMIVCVDLLKKGYEVFKAVSPSTSCDLAILKDNKLKRVEVRTGNMWMLSNPQAYIKRANIKADILAIINWRKNGKIIYFPSEF